MDKKAYVEIFLQEANENLQELNDNLLELELNPSSLEVLNNIFRIAHTFKGMSMTMGYTDVSDLTHKMEDVLSQFKNGNLKVTPNVITVLFKCLDILEIMILNIEESNEKVENTTEIVRELTLLTEKMDHVESKNKVEEKNEEKNELEYELNQHEEYVIGEAKKIGRFAYGVKVSIAKDSAMKSVRAYLIMQCLEGLGDVIKTIPCVEDLEEEKFDFDILFALLSDEEEEEISEALYNVAEVEKVVITNLTDKHKTYSDNINENVDSNEIDGQLKSINKEGVTDKEQSPNDSDKEDKDVAAANKVKNEVKRSNQLVKIDLQRVDELMSMVSEIVIQRTALEDYANNISSIELNSNVGNNNIKDIIESIKKTTTELQELVMKIRMLPLETVFNRFPRMIRDLSLELKKNVEFVIEGANIELDRTIVNEISEPLVHLLRNSMDHGIECPEERKKSGKNEKSILKLSASEEGNNVIIKVSDDGAGLCYEKIKNKAESLGINVNGLSEKEVLSLIFNQGFTTNNSVTNISGRGVGMDAVRNRIETFGGSVDFVTEEGAGTTFIIKLPLTLQVFQGLLIKVNDYTFTIQESFIDSIVFFEEDKMSMIDKECYYDLNGKVIPLIHLDKKLGLPEAQLTEDQQDERYIIIIKTGDSIFSVLVHDILAQREIVVKPIPETLKNINLYSGTTVLGNGTPVLILDISKFIV